MAAPTAQDGTASAPLLMEVEDGVARLTLNRPHRKNAISAAMRDDLLAAIRRCRADATVRSIVLRGAGTAFCAGMDLAESTLARLDEPGFEARAMSEALRNGLHAVLAELWELDKPTVAEVGGPAVGPGAHLALSCDFVIMSETASLIWSFTGNGLVIDAAGGYLLPRLVGLARAKELVLLDGRLGAQDAARLGLARVCPSADALSGEAYALARRLAQGPTWAMGMSKRLLNRSMETSQRDLLELEAAYQSLATTTADVRERLAERRRLTQSRENR